MAHEDEAWLHLRATPRVARSFSALKLYLADHVDMPVNPNAIIRIPKTARFENYTSNHGQIYSAGAFSYSENGVTEAVVGRYCSIAHDFWVMGERHPMERVTSSSFTYCRFPHWHKPQFLRGHRELLADAYPPEMPEIGTGPLPILEHDVWIGQQVILARRITVRTGAVVGAGAVVTQRRAALHDRRRQSGAADPNPVPGRSLPTAAGDAMVEPPSEILVRVRLRPTSKNSASAWRTLCERGRCPPMPVRSARPGAT